MPCKTDLAPDFYLTEAKAKIWNARSFLAVISSAALTKYCVYSRISRSSAGQAVSRRPLTGGAGRYYY